MLLEYRFRAYLVYVYMLWKQPRKSAYIGMEFRLGLSFQRHNQDSSSIGQIKRVIHHYLARFYMS